MISLERLYRESWTGRGRRAWTISKGELIFLKDFLRWLERYILKGEEMVILKTIPTDHLTILIFKNDTCEKSMVRYVAETILALGDDFAGVPTEAIHYAIPGHPFTGAKRFYEITGAYKRQWPGIGVILSKSHFVRKNHFYFTTQFMAWLRSNIDDIERVVFPVTVRRQREK